MDSTMEQDVCRLCTNQGGNYHSIFDTNSIVEKIHNCLPIVVDSNDKLPSHICNSCLEALNISDKLRSQCLVADSILRRQLMVATKIIKIENDEFDIKIEADNFNSEESNEFSDHNYCQSSVWICEFCEDLFNSLDDFLRHKSEKHQEKGKDIEKVKTNEDSGKRIADNATDNENIDIENAEVNGDFDNLVGDNVNADESVDFDNPEMNQDSNKLIENNSVEVALDIKDEDVARTGNVFIGTNSKVHCNICNARITDKYLRELHVKFHEPRPMFCNHCSDTFPSPYDLTIHKQAKHEIWSNFKMKWFCERCEHITYSRQVIYRHLKECTKEMNACKYCGKEFIYKLQVMPHILKDHQSDILKDPLFKKHKCPLCGECFIQKLVYKQHLSEHQVVKDQMYKCTHCEKRLSSIHKLKDHIERIHNTENIFKCSFCPKTSHNKKNMVLHKKKHHPLCCTKCDKQFGDFNALDQHWIKDHNKKPPKRGKYFCKTCGLKFPLFRELQDHETIHTGERPHTCTVCNKTFRTYSSHWAHKKVHKPNRFDCDYCKKIFKHKKELERHISKHQPPEDWRYRCKTCVIPFPTVRRLKRHEAQHGDTQIVTCDTCGKKLLGMHNLEKHRRRIHKGLATNTAVVNSN